MNDYGLGFYPLAETLLVQRLIEDNADLRELIVRYQRAFAQQRVDLEVAEAEIRSCRQRLERNRMLAREIL